MEEGVMKRFDMQKHFVLMQPDCGRHDVFVRTRGV